MESTAVPAALESLSQHRYVSLRTFRADGTPVDVPMWFATSGGAVHMRTPEASAKFKRMVRNPSVELRPCNVKGVVVDPLVLEGTATVLAGSEAEAGDRLLHARYRWQYNVVPMLPVPGVPTAPVDLPWSQRLRRMRATSLWDSHAVVRIEVAAT